MTDFMDLAQELFGTPESCREVFGELTARYNTVKRVIGTEQQIKKLINSVPEGDKMTLELESGLECSIHSTDGDKWKQSYADFLGELEDEDEISVTLQIEKTEREDRISVYSATAFKEFLCSAELKDLLKGFSELLRDKKRLILESPFALAHSYSIYINRLYNPDETWSRENQRQKCIEAGVFLERDSYPIIPEDFAITQTPADEKILIVFQSLRNILSYIYIANCASIRENHVLLQFDPTARSEAYSFEELSKCDTAYDIYKLVFTGEDNGDKAAIARSVISLRCKNKNDVLDISQSVIASIKSNLVIYRKKQAKKYIRMKNELSDYIVESSKQVLELSRDLADGIRNNFIAVVVFIISTILTDKIDIDSLQKLEITQSVRLVGSGITVLSGIYCVVTLVATWVKWGWVQDSYERLKGNYEDVLDKEDINLAFANDKANIAAKKRLLWLSIAVSALWIVLVIVMARLFGFFSA